MYNTNKDTAKGSNKRRKSAIISLRKTNTKEYGAQTVDSHSYKPSKKLAEKIVRRITSMFLKKVVRFIRNCIFRRKIKERIINKLKNTSITCVNLQLKV